MALEQIGLAAVLDDRNFQQGLSRYTKGLGQMTSLTDGAAKMLSGAFIAGIGAVTVAASATLAAAKIGLDATLQWAEQLDKLGDQFGMSGQVASGWAFLMNRVGLSVDEGAQGLNYFTNQLGSFGKVMKDGKLQTTPFSDALAKLGVNAIDPVTKKVKTFDQLMPQIMDKFQKLPAGIDASALAMDLFGARGGTKFLDFLRQGAKGLDDAKKKAQEFGLDLSTDEVNAAEEFGFAMNELNLEFTGLKNTIGRYVLPIAKELVRWISVNAIPPLITLAKQYVPLLVSWFRSLGDWTSKYLLPRLRQFTDWIARDALPFVRRIIDSVGTLIDIFQRGDWGDFTDFIGEWADELRGWGTRFWDWLTGPDGALSQAAGKIGEFAGRLGKALVENWPAISAQFATWKDQFWNWLTGPGGAIYQAAANVSQVAGKIAEWLSNNWDGQIAPTLQGWIGLFWEWVTGKGGLVDTAATTMGNLTAAISEWAHSTDTQRFLNNIGKNIALMILDGIANLFKDQGQSDSVMTRLVISLNQARINLGDSIAAIGGGIASGLVQGAIIWLTGQDASEQLRAGLNTWFTAAVNAFVLQNIGDLVALIRNAILSQVFGTTNPEVPRMPEYLPPGYPTYQRGGYVPRNMLARLHAGEYVLPASTVSHVINNNQRTINPGAVVLRFEGGSSLSESQIENAVYRGVKLVMDGAA